MPARIKFKKGEKYGRLTTLREVDPINGRRAVKCRCDCGEYVIVVYGWIRKGNTLSCGCLRRETTAAKNTTHGLSKKMKEYVHWKSMRSRCYNKNCEKYKTYGARGVIVHPSWDDFTVFLRDVGPAPSPSHSLDRFPDRKGNYEPGNVRWATAKEQARNRDCMPTVEFEGKVVLVIELAERVGTTSTKLLRKLRGGMSIYEALAISEKRGSAANGDRNRSSFKDGSPRASKA